jgi:signal transduction histidine kinase
VFSNNEALSRVSHELRNPLNAILAFGQLLALDELNESQRHSVEQILAGGRHLLSLLEDLLDLSRLAADNLELSEQPVDVADEIAQAATLCGPLAGERSLTLSVEPGEKPLWALADPRRLKQVLLNLISNAIKFNRAGGSVTLLAVQPGDGRVRIDVIDTGMGMTAEELSRAFAPFERLDGSRHGIEGNGLGLAVSRALAQAMGGSLDVVSTPRVGSVFSLRLVAARPAASPAGLGPPAERVLASAA